jgi:hypothetical protein
MIFFAGSGCRNRAKLSWKYRGIWLNFSGELLAPRQWSPISTKGDGNYHPFSSLNFLSNQSSTNYLQNIDKTLIVVYTKPNARLSGSGSPRLEQFFSTRIGALPKDKRNL